MSSIDLSGWHAALDRLNGEAKESIARHMGAAGGRVLRDEAKMRVPVSVGPFNPTSRGAQDAWELYDSIYLAYDARNSGGNTFSYHVSWNAKKAWWGKLVEFGHFQRYPVYQKKDGTWATLKKKGEVENPKFIKATPFLGPTYDSHILIARNAMFEAGRKRLSEILGGMK